MDFRKNFMVKAGGKVDLRKIDPGTTGGLSRKEGRELLQHNLRRIEELQERLYGEHKQSVLIVLQGMDAGGKDGTVRTIGGAMNPQGVHVVSFKVPSKQEQDHDFLWRVHKEMPGKGEVGIFNRSHYEDVLVVRVHDLVPKDVWKKRYDIINNFERAAAANGTKILKFFLHISKQEQLKRFGDRLHNPAKNWKISDADYSERPFWNDYQKAYTEALSKCSTKDAPWFVVPADHKWFRNLVISQIVLDCLEEMKMKFPAPTVDLKEIEKKYHSEERKERVGARRQPQPA